MTEPTEREDVFLAKLMCERKGKKDGIPLGVSYWNRSEWKMFFKQQILAANSLLKIYPFSVVVTAVKHKKYLWVFSLRSPQLKQILEEEFERHKRKAVIEEKRAEKAVKAAESSFDVKSTDEAPIIMEETTSLKSRLD